MGFLDWVKNVLGITVELESSLESFLIDKDEKRTQVIKNYKNETINFRGNWNLTHFEQLTIIQDGENTKITLPNNQIIIVKNTQASSFTPKNFSVPSKILGDYDGMPTKFYTGTEADDRAEGVWTVGSTLKGLGGNDRLGGGLKGDAIDGGEGNDEIYGLGGDDILEGNAGNDHIYGGIGADRILGGDGDDTLEGEGTDYDSDRLEVEPADDLIDGGLGNDVIKGGKGNNTLTGGLGSDIFVFNPQKEQNDIITDFEPGIDSVHLEKFPDMAFENLIFIQSGVDACITFPEGQTLTFKNIEKESLTAENFKLNGSPMPRAYYVGTPGDDWFRGYRDVNNIIYGGAGNDRLMGSTMADTIHGEEGHDWIFSGGSDDKIYGGSGDDKIQGENGDDTLSGGDGSDLICGDEGDDMLLGDSGNDFLQGGDGDDIIYGGAGDDYIRGDKGNNILIGGSGTNHFIIASRPGEQDIIEDYDPGREKIYFDSSTIGSFSELKISKEDLGTCLSLPNEQKLILEYVDPSELNAKLFIFDPDQMPHKIYTGTENTDYAVGHKILSNTMSGLGGADLLRGGDYRDIIFGGAGDDRLEGGRGDDVLYGNEGNDVIDGGPGDDTLYANEGDNLLKGEGGDDVLYSGPGVNVLMGGAGRDTLHIMGPGQFGGGSDQDVFKVHVLASPTLAHITSSRPCLSEDTFKPYEEFVITDFDISKNGDTLDLSDFRQITSLESMTVTETEVPGKPRNFGLCLKADDTTIALGDYRNSEPAPLLTLSTKDTTPRVLVQLYGVKKTDLRKDHFIFSSLSDISPSVTPLEMEGTAYTVENIPTLSMAEPLILSEEVNISPYVLPLGDFLDYHL